jgi:putative ABC transport system substrate-binding protein
LHGLVGVIVSLAGKAMRRRDFIAGVAGSAAAWPRAVHAQQSAKVPRIGFLRLGPPSSSAARVKALQTGLRELGYVEGKNITIEFRFAETVEQLTEFAAELVRINVDIIFATSSTEVGIVQPLTKTIPIVFATHADPIGIGHVASLSRPGGNITGLSMLMTELSAKALEVLKEVLPQATRFGVLFTPTAPSYAPLLQVADAVGEKLRVKMHKVSVQSVDDFDAAFATMARERVDGVMVHGASLTGTHSGRLAELTLKHRLPTMFLIRDNVEAGGLLCYGPDLLDLTRRAATYIDQILKGAKPADLPVEQATKFELVVNNKTAKAIGLMIPASFLLRADEVIE